MMKADFLYNEWNTIQRNFIYTKILISCLLMFLYIIFHSNLIYYIFISSLCIIQIIEKQYNQKWIYNNFLKSLNDYQYNVALHFLYELELINEYVNKLNNLIIPNNLKNKKSFF